MWPATASYHVLLIILFVWSLGAWEGGVYQLNRRDCLIWRVIWRQVWINKQASVHYATLLQLQSPFGVLDVHILTTR